MVEGDIDVGGEIEEIQKKEEGDIGREGGE
jgi:hypothetical protein